MGATAAAKKITHQSLLLYTVSCQNFPPHLSPSFWLKPFNLLDIQNTASAHHPMSPQRVDLGCQSIS